MPRGILRKMETELKDGEVYYQLSLGGEKTCLNNQIGHKISLRFENVMICLGHGGR